MKGNSLVTDPKEEQHLPVTAAFSSMRAVRWTFLVFAHRFSLQGRGHVWEPHGEDENLKGLWWRRRFIFGVVIQHAPLPDATAAGPTSTLGVHFGCPLFWIQAPTNSRMKSGWSTVSLAKKPLTQKDNQSPLDLCRWHKFGEYKWILCCFASAGPFTLTVQGCTLFLSASSSNLDFYLFIYLVKRVSWSISLIF